MTCGRSLLTKGGEVGHLLPGLVWLSVPDTKDGPERCSQAASKLVAKAIACANIDGFAVTADMITSALPPPWGTSQGGFDLSPGEDLPPVVVLYPEEMAELDCCVWKGSGHYDMSVYHTVIPPHIGQVVGFNRILSRVAQPSANPRGKPFVVVLSTHAKKAFVSVLAGSAMILLGNDDPEDAWSEILRVCPSPSSSPCEAWDRFPPTFSMSGQRSQTSLRVIDCLKGLEAATQLGWLDFRAFNVAEWHLLRDKFDASWLIPGDILALADPSITAQNPRFPGLLDPVKDAAKKWQPPLSACPPYDSGNDDSTTASPNSMLSTLGITEGANDIVDELVLDVDEVQDIDVQRVNVSPSFKRMQSIDKAFFSVGSSIGSRSAPAHLSSMSSAPKSSWSDRMIGGKGNSEADRAARSLAGGYPAYFERVGIGSLVRLNFLTECREQRKYDGAFDPQILQITPCEFLDGTPPKKDVVKDFILGCTSHQAMAAQTSGRPMIAVHCKGGLGRTGSVIAAYAVSKYGISGEAFHGFSRLMRPGVIQTPEQEKFVRGLTTEQLRRWGIPTRRSSPSPPSSSASPRSFLSGFALRPISLVSPMASPTKPKKSVL
eukprot:CAMPEP_0195085846 /NCGR_PEP_ID=MMETSP0448-20130528/26156_1 /TAXON_ID=66468 /ORGANISM="Heterocapsa triquestra, Strain CCMP 448" /LENGTH=602 /DNA_ID=CAMNT_0040119263 /DNA_START=116 /DNA_END=1927 /DNA_ORIENTATION=+